jgi:hypothetical protein
MSGKRTDSCSCEVAAQASALTYRLAGHTPQIRSIGPDGPGTCAGRMVIVPELSHAEAVLDDETDFGAAREELAALNSAGWNAWAVVPIARLGEAHVTFADATECVQGWWTRGDLGVEPPVAFTEPHLS